MNVAMLSVIILSVGMPGVAAPFKCPFLEKEKLKENVKFIIKLENVLKVLKFQFK